MSCQRRQSHETRFREALGEAGARLEQLRFLVERRGVDARMELERRLDTARGLHNRALARIEAARQASEDGWPFARAQADHTLSELVQALDELEGHLARAVA